MLSTCVINKKNYILVCGSNIHGKLALDSDYKYKDVLTQITMGNKFISVSVGRYHMMALDIFGSLWCCGLNRASLWKIMVR